MLSDTTQRWSFILWCLFFHEFWVILRVLSLSGDPPVLCIHCIDPDWASYKLGVFVCLNCSGVHRNLSNISRVKSIRLDFWDDELVKVLNGSLTAVVNTNPGSGDLQGVQVSRSSPTLTRSIHQQMIINFVLGWNKSLHNQYLFKTRFCDHYMTISLLVLILEDHFGYWFGLQS